MSKAFRFKPTKKKANDGGYSAFSNGDRAEFADRAIESYLLTSGEPLEGESTVGDLIANLLHYCDREHYDAEAVLRMAQNHWEEER